MNRVEYAEYLESDHWKALKVKKSKRAKLCWCCGVKPDVRNFHHVRYKQIYDVTTRDIRLVCEDCHHFYHALKKENPRLAKAPIDLMMDAVQWEILSDPDPNASDETLYATHQGILSIGPHKFRVYHLNNGQRVIHEEDIISFFKA